MPKLSRSKLKLHQVIFSFVGVSLFLVNTTTFAADMAPGGTVVTKVAFPIEVTQKGDVSFRYQLSWSCGGFGDYNGCDHEADASVVFHIQDRDPTKRYLIDPNLHATETSWSYLPGRKVYVLHFTTDRPNLSMTIISTTLDVETLNAMFRSDQFHTGSSPDLVVSPPTPIQISSSGFDPKNILDGVFRSVETQDPRRVDSADHHDKVDASYGSEAPLQAEVKGVALY